MEKEIKNIKQEEVKPEVKTEEKPKMRQIIIETDGNSINIVKAEVAGNLELTAILSTIINKINIK